MKTYRLSHNLSLIDVEPDIPGYKSFFSIYVIQAQKLALVDVGPAVAAASLISGLEELHIDPSKIDYILLSHVHIDHAGSAGQILEQMPQAKVVVHGKGVPHLINPTRLWEASQETLGETARQYGPPRPIPADRIVAGEEGMIIDLGGVKLEVIETPGHATHHLSYWDKQERRLFAGESAGVYVPVIKAVRPACTPPFNLEVELATLDKQIDLQPEVVCYGHFGSLTQAVDRLTGMKQQLVRWGNIIADGFEKGASQQEIHRAIRENDNVVPQIESLPTGEHQREMYFIKDGIEGFMGYFQKHGTRYLRSILP